MYILYSMVLLLITLKQTLVILTYIYTSATPATARGVSHEKCSPISNFIFVFGSTFLLTADSLKFN